MKTLVISASGLNLAYVGCYGSDWSATPSLDELAARSVVFDEHCSNRPDPAGARAAWARGLYDFPMPAEAEKPAGAADLLSLLGREQIATALVGPAGSSLNAEAGWTFAERVAQQRAKRAFDETLRAVEAAQRALAGKERWLLWVELPTLLPPWKIPAAFLDACFESAVEEFGDPEAAAEELNAPLVPLLKPTLGLLDPSDDETFARLQHTYAAAVGHLDQAVGRILDSARAHGVEEQLAVVFTADHGLPLGEHGMVGVVRPWLHEELLHVPLILRLPRDADAGRRTSALTQPIDLLPTLADLFAVPLPPVHGKSLLPLARGEVDEIRPYACSGLRVKEAVEWSVRTHRWSYLLPIRPAEGDERRPAQLYVKPDDRWEVNNVIQHHPALAEHLEQVLRGFVVASAAAGPLHPPGLQDVEALLQSQQEERTSVPPES